MDPDGTGPAAPFTFGDLDVRRDARALLGDRPDNVFLVKATYWLGR